jgi:hypothetical protein
VSIRRRKLDRPHARRGYVVNDQQAYGINLGWESGLAPGLR